jgi:hypothetical protein
MLSAIFYGMRISLFVGAVSVVVALAIGVVVGLVAAYAGGKVDALLMRIVDLMLSFPAILVALILLSVLGKGIDKVLVALILVQWAYLARAARGAALVERNKEYVEAATCLALPASRIVFGHMLPNAMLPALTMVGVILGTVISSLSWLIVAFWPTVTGGIFSLGFLALGEIIQSPRYYEYISRLAPPGQQGTYMGFAFLPIGIGSLIGGWFGGRVMHHFGEVMHQPQRVWWVISSVGVLTALLLWMYDRVVKPGQVVTGG